MIRHTPSFFISLLIHSLLIGAFFYTYKYVTTLPSEKKDELVCVNLQCITHKDKELIKEKPKPKKIPPKTLKSKVEKPKVKQVLQESLVKPLSVPVKKEEMKPLEEHLSLEPIKEELEEAEEFTLIPSQEEKAVTQEEEYMDENIKKIVTLLSENLYYPRSARKRGIVGEVVVKFSLATDSTVSSIKVVSSKSETLSRSAIKTIQDLSGEFPKPREHLIIHLPLKYELNE